MSVVAVITREEEIQATLTWGLRFARAKHTSLCIVHPTFYPQEQPPTPVALSDTSSIPLLESIRIAAEALKPAVAPQEVPPEETEASKADQASDPEPGAEEEQAAPSAPTQETSPSQSADKSQKAETQGGEEPAIELMHLQGPDRLKMILRSIKEEQGSLVVTGQSSLRDKQQQEDGLSLRKALLEQAPCDVLLLRAGESKVEDCKKILVPTAGGPHATAALKLAAQFSQTSDAKVKALYIEQEAGEEAEAVGQRVLKKVMRKAEVQTSKDFTTSVVLADDVSKGIAKVVEEEGDVGLVLFGATNLGFMRRMLFGTIPDKFLEGRFPVTIGIMRAARPMAQRTKDYFEDLFERFVPPLSREDRINLFEHLQNGSKASVNFIILIGLSTAIAAFGLIQNSGAVIIGAMLVAPLMTPMLGMGLGLVQGNIVLVRQAVYSIILGFLLSFCIGLSIGLLTPSFQSLTPEILARGRPGLLDLFVALLSGLAAAYALARPGLLEALPGVAIAAALVPPIASAGLSLAVGNTDNAIGAASLFGINLICIILASAITLYVLGVRANKRLSQLWSRRVLIALSMVALLIAFPLGTALLGQVPTFANDLRSKLSKHIDQMPGLTFAQLEWKRHKKQLLISIYTPRPLNAKQVRSIVGFVRTHHRKEHHEALDVRLISILSTSTHHLSATPQDKRTKPKRTKPKRTRSKRPRPRRVRVGRARPRPVRVLPQRLAPSQGRPSRQPVIKRRVAAPVIRLVPAPPTSRPAPRQGAPKVRR